MKARTKPYAYEVEYLESSGTQYIDLGLVVPPNVDFEFTGAIVSDITNGCIFGESKTFQWGSNNPAYSLVTTSGGRTYLRYGNDSGTIIGLTTIGLGQTFTAALTGGEFKINGQTVATVTRISEFSANVGNMGCFRRNYSDTSNVTCAAVRINRLKFGNLFDLLPVVNLLGVACMYDRVTGRLFYNAGTGSFTAGPRVGGLPYKYEVEYLESTGTQYVDTEYAFADDFAWEVKCSMPSSGTTVFGGRTSSIRTAVLFHLNFSTNPMTAPIAGFTGRQTPFVFGTLTGVHTYKMTVAEGSGSTWLDDVPVQSNVSFSGTYISGVTQAIFADNFGSSVSEYSDTKVYHVKMWQNSLLVRDYIPVVDLNDRPALYDRVSKTLFHNAGTGEFTVGPRKYDLFWGIARKIRFAQSA